VTALYKIFLLATGKSVVWFAVSNSIEYMLIAILLIIMYRVKGGAHISFSLRLGRRMFAKSKYYILSNMMVVVFTHTGKILINILLDDAATGYYSAAAAIIAMPSFVFTAVVDSFRPLVLKSNTMEQLNENMIKLYAIVFYLAFAQCVGISVLAQPIVNIIYGAEYMASVGVLRIGIWYTIISYMAFARGVWILAAGRQKYLWIINLSGAITNLAVNFIVIPRVGILGAAISSVVTEFVANIVVCYFVKSLREGNMLMLKAINPKVLLSILRG
jgi:O-antigen/teichoic acid export membrane protein